MTLARRPGPGLKAVGSLWMIDFGPGDAQVVSGATLPGPYVIDTTGATLGQVLAFDGTKFVPTGSAGGSYTAGAGLTLTGTVFSLNLGFAAHWTAAGGHVWDGPGSFANAALTLSELVGMGGVIQGRASPSTAAVAYAVAIIGGLGHDTDGVSPGTAGGGLFATGNSGGAGSATLAAGAGGSVQSVAGDAGAANGGPGANGGDYNLDAGGSSGGGHAGDVKLGTSKARKVLLGRTSNTTEVQGTFRADNDVQIASIDVSGTPGDAFGLNCNAGRVAVASGSDVIHVSNSRVTPASKVFATIAQDTADATAKRVARTAPGVGAFAIYLDAVATGNVVVDWFMVNP